ncbi:MAG: hypothetical protein LBH19_13545, partial [Dysgonamonadaceae bacterium]|nr:hypothetical protein [Dysgonamonadaceae bacterium]
MSFFEPKRKPVEKVNNLLSVNGFTGTEPFKMIVSVNHSEDVKPFGPFRRNIDVFSRKQPSVRNVAFCADMGFIAIEK